MKADLFTQLYKWVPAIYCWGVTLRWTFIPSQGGVAILLGMLHAKETGISSVHLGAHVHLNLFFSLQIMYLEAVVGKCKSDCTDKEVACCGEVAVLFQGFMEYFFIFQEFFYKIILIASFCCLFPPE